MMDNNRIGAVGQTHRALESKSAQSKSASVKNASALGICKATATFAAVILGHFGNAAAAATPANALAAPKNTGASLRDRPADARPQNLALLPAASAVAAGSEPRFVSGHDFAMACVESAYVGVEDRASVAAYIESINSWTVSEALENCAEALAANAAEGNCVSRDGQTFHWACLDDAAAFFPHQDVNPLAFAGYRAYAPNHEPALAPAFAPRSAQSPALVPQAGRAPKPR